MLETLFGGVPSSMLSSAAVNRLAKLYDYLSTVVDAKRRDAVVRAEAMRSTELLSTYLGRRYRHLDLPLMSRVIRGHRISVPGLFFPAGPAQTSVNHLLGRLYVRYAPELWDAESSKYVALRRALNSRIDNNDMFSLIDLSRDADNIVVNAQLTKYVPCLVHQDALEWELLHTLAEDAPTLVSSADWTAFERKLHLRNAIEGISGWPYRTDGRPSGLSISTLIVYRERDGSYHAFFGKRSSLTANHSDLFHVVPACMFQPELGDPRLEWNVEHGILKEYGEELFGEELDRKAASPTYFYTRWQCVRQLRDALQDPAAAELIPCGVFMNLLNHRVELCTVLLIHDSSFWQGVVDQISLNWEYHDRQSIVEVLGRAQTFYDLDRAEEQFFSDFPGDPGLWVPPGLAAFFAGVERARERIGR